jgi:Flp pilus assembly protein TadG
MMAIAMPLKGGRLGWNEGAVAAEAALTFSLLFTLIFGIIEFGTALWQWNTMLLAVQQAGRYVMINSGATPPCGTSCAESQMQTVLSGSSISCPLPSSPAAGAWYVCATQNTGTSPQTMTLSAAYGYNVIGLTGPLKATSQATVPLD